MGGKTKFIVIGLIGVSVIFIFLYIQTLNSKQIVIRERDDLKKENISLSSKIDKLENSLRDYVNKNEQLQKEKSAFELDIDNLRRENEDLRHQVEYNKKLMDGIAQELTKEKNEKVQSQESLNSIINKNRILVQQLKSLSNRKINLERKLRELQEEKAAIERSAASTEMPSEQKESVELPPIVVRPQTESAQRETSSTLEGKILAVNKESNFVIIDLGEDGGVKVGDIFQVYREDKSIATIEVIQARKSIAACDIKKETSPIKIGDIVR